MSSSEYLVGRRKYQRPQGMLWADNPGTLVDGLYVPNGYEINGNTGSETNSETYNQFLILSDDGRAPINFTQNRIEKRERMINGKMRSYHIADKLSFDISWKDLPSRAFAEKAKSLVAESSSAFAGYRGWTSSATHQSIDRSGLNLAQSLPPETGYWHRL